jgi:hypothetical protein
VGKRTLALFVAGYEYDDHDNRTTGTRTSRTLLAAVGYRGIADQSGTHLKIPLGDRD